MPRLPTNYGDNDAWGTVLNSFLAVSLNSDGSLSKSAITSSIGPSSAYTVTNGTTDRAFNADSTSIDELADVLATLIADLKTAGLLT